MSPLQEAIENLYAVFAVYPLRKHVEGCPCCVREPDHARLHSKPLRQLSGEDLNPFAAKSLTTWGDEHDLKHFLPRLLELMAAKGLNIDGEILTGKLIYTGKGYYPGWHRWPETEQAAIRQFFMALWEEVLGKDPAYPMAHDWLWVIGRAEDDLQPYLQAWRDAGSDSALRHLVHAVHDEYDSLLLATVEMLNRGIELYNTPETQEEFYRPLDWLPWCLTRAE